LREFFMWLAYLKMEPPEEAENVRMAALMAQITNMAGRSLPGKKFVDAEDFLGGKQQQTLDEQKAFMKSMTGNKDGS
jgi:hypothetical protein